ncbi:hypothetical protein Trydic_g7142 [Trypoxylus dichotomus]
MYSHCLETSSAPSRLQPDFAPGISNRLSPIERSWVIEMTAAAGKDPPRPAFTLQRGRGAPLSEPTLQQKAISLAEDLHITEYPDTFTASNDWLERWKKRYGIRQLTMCGRKLSADTNVIGNFTCRFRKLIAEKCYSIDQNYNCDKTDLNYKMAPSKTLASRTHPIVPGYKKSNEHVTILAPSNASESILEKIIEGNYGLIDSLKQINLKKIVCWTADSWNKVKEPTIQKSWSKIIGPEDILDGDNLNNDHDTMFEFFQKLPDCEDITKEDFIG